MGHVSESETKVDFGMISLNVIALWNWGSLNIKNFKKDENCSLKHLQVQILNAIFCKISFGSKEIVIAPT